LAATVIGHAFAEGWSILKHRLPVSLGLGLALALPLMIAGLTIASWLWLEPVTASAGEVATTVVLDPGLDLEAQRRWVDERRVEMPSLEIELIEPEAVAERLERFFPYLEQLLVDSPSGMIPPLVEVSGGDPRALEGTAGVLAIGPRSDLPQRIDHAGRRLAFLLLGLATLLLVGAMTLSAVWVHLELFRHADEISVMRLVGAPESAVRGPFLVAISAPGVFAAITGPLGTLFAVQLFDRPIALLELPLMSVPSWVLGAEVVLGLALPLIATWITLGRHAKLEVD
jgi:cell division protein FtsX